MFKHESAVSSDVHHSPLFKRMNKLRQTLKKHKKAEQFKASSVSCLQSAWSPNCPGSTWPTRCGSRSRICSTGSTGRHWASSTRSKCLTRGSRTTPTRSSSRAFPPASPSGSPAPSAPRTWRGSWPSPTKSVSPSPGGNARSHDHSHVCVTHTSVSHIGPSVTSRQLVFNCTACLKRFIKSQNIRDEVSPNPVL